MAELRKRIEGRLALLKRRGLSDSNATEALTLQWVLTVMGIVQRG